MYPDLTILKHIGSLGFALYRENTPAPPAAPIKLKGHKAKEAKRKAKKEAEVKAPKESGNRCATCGWEFSSRNKMFAHFKRTNHAQHLG